MQLCSVQRKVGTVRPFPLFVYLLLLYQTTQIKCMSQTSPTKTRKQCFVSSFNKFRNHSREYHSVNTQINENKQKKLPTFVKNLICINQVELSTICFFPAFFTLLFLPGSFRKEKFVPYSFDSTNKSLAYNKVWLFELRSSFFRAHFARCYFIWKPFWHVLKVLDPFEKMLQFPAWS